MEYSNYYPQIHYLMYQLQINVSEFMEQVRHDELKNLSIVQPQMSLDYTGYCTIRVRRWVEFEVLCINLCIISVFLLLQLKELSFDVSEYVFIYPLPGTKFGKLHRILVIHGLLYRFFIFLCLSLLNLNRLVCGNRYMSVGLGLYYKVFPQAFLNCDQCNCLEGADVALVADLHIAWVEIVVYLVA